ncbi:hypothetical protein J2X71_004062 [Rhizobium sp. 1399]|jgi:hypothetical protein|nr:hypothetical protein [Rhizobium sp. 1399]
MSNWKRALLILAVVVAVSCMAAAFLTACQSYQPPGEGIWRALQLSRLGNVVGKPCACMFVWRFCRPV